MTDTARSIAASASSGSTSQSPCFIGLMSGTSLDGVDGVLVDASDGRVLAESYLPFPRDLRETLMVLQAPSENELHREALAANALVRIYADCVNELLSRSGVRAEAVAAIGAHGQTIRHRPGEFDGVGYTRQLNAPALLAELTGIDVVADIRSRDVAAGGQGAPLVPAYHQAMFAHASETRVVCNLGGISNVTILPALASAQPVSGFDCGPGNALLDGWAARHLGTAYDDGGAWGAGGQVDPALLAALLNEPYFAQSPPKSTGRDLFHAKWLDAHLAAFPGVAPVDVQATLVALTAQCVASDVLRHAPDCRGFYACGGGTRNRALMHAIAARLPGITVATTEALGVPPQQVEARAFAWLAQRCVAREPGNLPSVTGAKGPRILGAIYPR
ncbi:Anhydro-N-acetylmuramic acid kinase [Pandoraea pnomenusa]|jgi:anhydro-N-acetylmuramic acid kinase|uniref:Anhydro-N-acetylmuramic acid kinase n=2 Tax=Pseudomonadota TaxID=1224 RepID=A0ABY6WCW2_9BURK|nr:MULTISPECIES: anhydro-N-acetylmuramic acid kinase [Pandoraea]MBN9092268.1 anhydro-N-acetylmuramic acid kinase [Pandoraea pnomenusa]QDH58537.1 anhydro-N-acetylmuramic acid kinase [Pandoraea pnomenusa]VVE59886.1 Anhydro-N-acetylmuramic acid kinase [Pandoraea pnomenusa]